jgi:cyclic beta-1,2-glucan synthetase
MGADSRRVVLGFYASEEEYAQQAWRAVRPVATHAHYHRSDGTSDSSTPLSEKYASLRLKDEELVVAEVASAKVPGVVGSLRSAGEPSIFVLRPDKPLPAGQRAPTIIYSWRGILDRLKECEATLKSARSDLIEAKRLDHVVTESAKWLLDNAYLLRSSIAEIRRCLPRGFRQALSRFATRDGNLHVCELARSVVSTADRAISEENLVAAVENYQKKAPFSIAELWVFPVMLRFALVESVAALAERISREQQLREEAYLWANRLAASARSGQDNLAKMLALLAGQTVAIDPYFDTCLTEQLQDEEPALVPVQQWIEAKQGASLAELVRPEHQREAAESLSIANAFNSLRTLSRIDFAKFFESLNVVEIELRNDPSGVYPRNDFQTRDRCRRAVESISRRSGRSEQDVARRAIELAGQGATPDERQVCWYLLADGLERIEKDLRTRVPLLTWFKRTLRKRGTLVYVGGVIAITLCFLIVALSLAWEMGVRQPAVLLGLGALALFPLSELAIQILNAFIISTFEPEPLPKLDFDDGIPLEDTTLVVVPMMLTSVEVVRQEVEKLEVRHLANRDRNIYFSLFSDFVDAEEASAPGDAELVQEIRSGIDQLNRKYEGGRFLLFHRRRVWSETQQRWIGRERKRGKIEELNLLLLGQGAADIKITGELPATPVRYVITLDADTQLPPETARQMIATSAHPLNRPMLDPASKVRRRGFTIIQPRVSIGLPGAMATRFTRIFADTTGTDPYTRTVSDAQQDLFGEAIFHGKAIYDVAAFQDSVGNRFPAETLLSHDLIEGSYVGTALATDIELFENMPLDYASFCKRQHRWIRGDWQIAAWMRRRVPGADGSKARNPLSAISRWRILDNLRRSVVPVASMLLLLLGWLISPSPGTWSLVVGLAIAIPAAAPLLDRLARRIHGSVLGWQGAHDEVWKALVLVAFLPHQALLSMDAIVRVWYRRRISRRHLLEWQTAEHAASTSQLHLSATMRQMIGISICSALLTIVLAAHHAFAPISLFVVLWILSPALLWWLSRPVSDSAQRRLLHENQRLLRGLARQTWRFFDDLVGPDTHWLPPDNKQMALHVEVANRTSPTNIGFWLCSVLAARDFGYLTSDEARTRCSHTMDTLEKLQRYEGHVLNWYNTTTAEPLYPRYVSTVDSGNLLASLWVFVQGCQEALRSSLINQSCMRGLADTLGQIERLSQDDPSFVVPLETLRKLLRGKGDGLQLIGRLRMAALPAEQLSKACQQLSTDDEHCYWASRLTAEVAAWNAKIDTHLKWVETLTRLPDSLLSQLGSDTVKLRRRAVHGGWTLQTLASGGPVALQQILARRNLPGIDARLVTWLEELEKEHRQAQENAATSAAGWQSLSERGLNFANDINMGFLYDHRRKLFGIGYMVGGPVEFLSHYDLLASECRIASLVAIAKGEVPLEHWYALGRPRVAGPDGQTLLSWSGTMFEYLMPLLFTRTFANSLLDGACRNAVVQQMSWAREKNLPWGVSECAYSALDSHQTYQYRAFGVPSLAMNAGMDEGEVIAPYATMMSLQIDPRAAIANIIRLQTLGLDGPMGLYEAIDFTLESSRGGQRGVVIYTYMAHHQGMSLLALNNLLHRNVMQRRFHADRRVRAIESLLFERVPNTPLPEDDVRTGIIAPTEVTVEDPPERIWKENTAVPRVHLYGNGRYALMVSNSGGGYSRWNEFDVSRWRSDTTRDCWGNFIYIRDARSNILWSASWQPVGGSMGISSTRFLADHTEFYRRVLDIETVQAATVAAEDDVELRRLTMTNWSARSRDLDLTSYVELALASHGADTAHPAFAKMFVETEYAGDGLLIAHRRPRSPEEPAVWAGHLLVGASGQIDYETDRETFIGRGNTTASPQALRRNLNHATGTVVDPIFSLRCRISLAPRDRIELGYITMAAGSREELLSLVEKYRRPGAVAKAFDMMWTRSQLEFRYLGIGPARAHRFQELASYLVYPNVRLRSPERIARNRLGQSALWALGISGDLPILSVTIADDRGINVVREVLQAHTYWRMRGFRADLVLLNQESPSYDTPLRVQLQRLIEAHSVETGTDKAGGVFLRDWHPMPEDLRNLILASSSVSLSANRESLQQQLSGISEPSAPGARVVSTGGSEEPSLPLPFLELPYFNGRGGFTGDGREYAIYLKPGDNTPAPWANVMANPDFGAMVTESGLGFTWRGNSQMNRLTPWNNDPVTDEPSEVIYLRDEESGISWSPTPQPIREKDAYRARHGQGYTVFEHNSHAIGQELTVFVPVNENGTGDPVKVYRLRLRNDSSRARVLSVTYFADWVLGSVRESSQLHIQTARDAASGAIVARQNWNGTYAGHTAFAASSPGPVSYSCDRTMFLGRNRRVSRPAALERARLENREGVAMDPAVALQVAVTLEIDATAEVVFLLGQTENIEECRALIKRYQTPDQIEGALAATRNWWDSVLGAVQVRTPVMSTDLMLNRWLLYQSLSCRFWGRSAFYQSGGAVGFRDQLQDSLGFVYAAPQLTRSHILAAAARQFLEGDVQHWWHAETGMGVRTRCSDDMLWLPFVVEHYVKVTGDEGILEELVPFLEGPVLVNGEAERMFIPSISRVSAPLWEHCQRALDRAWQRGPHDLPLIGNGDWNDGMNHVGAEGRGESVWLAWFEATVLNSFGAMMAKRGAPETAAYDTWRERATLLQSATEQSAWDGDWYLRAFFDDGSPLGSRGNEEAKIDSLPQSWAVISGLGDATRSRQAMESAQHFLVDTRYQLVRLFTPPFDHSWPHPGYLMGYPPGLRENGGQYTHGSLWMAMAWARLGDGCRAAGLLTMMNPIEHTRTPVDVDRYCGEPYVAPADVSTAKGREGRAGWTWYTGSASWMYRIWIEEVLGLKVRGDTLAVEPVLPANWPGFELRYRYRSTTYEIKVQRDAPMDTVHLSVDGNAVSGGNIQLIDDGEEHQVLARVPRPPLRLLPPAGEPGESESAAGEESQGEVAEDVGAR